MIKRLFNWQIIKKTLSVFVLFFVAACGSAPPRQPLALEQAKKSEHEAHRALHDGDLMRARELFKLSMLRQQSLDNLPAAAIAAINLASVSHKLGDDVTALALLDSVLGDSTGHITAELRATAAFRKAIILAATDRKAEADSALQLAGQACNKQCGFAQGINNLSARLALAKGDFTTALSIAKSVVEQGAEKEELANAQRIAAAAESALQQNEAALAHFQIALALDQELAISARIEEDLIGISTTLEKLGRKTEAELFLRRAEAVAFAAKALTAKGMKR
jgi:tetratricopeptide (TPR) repeat protein